MSKILCTDTTAIDEIKDVVLDTDAFNEIDDQFAIAYLLRSAPRLNTVAIYAAPFSNRHTPTPAEGMQQSYREIEHMLHLCCEVKPIFTGSDRYLTDEYTPVLSPAALDLSKRAMRYSSEKPLYVVAIGAITNIASAILLNPDICDRIVVVWLGGHAHHWHDTKEFNMRQDYNAARAVMLGVTRFIQLPCQGVVSEFRISRAEFAEYLLPNDPLSAYLAEILGRYMDIHSAGKHWSKVLWDVAAVAYLQNNDFMYSRTEPLMLPDNNGYYIPSPGRNIEYVYGIKRDNLTADLFQKITPDVTVPFGTLHK